MSDKDFSLVSTTFQACSPTERERKRDRTWGVYVTVTLGKLPEAGISCEFVFTDAWCAPEQYASINLNAVGWVGGNGIGVAAGWEEEWVVGFDTVRYGLLMLGFYVD